MIKFEIKRKSRLNSSYLNFSTGLHVFFNSLQHRIAILNTYANFIQLCKIVFKPYIFI